MKNVSLIEIFENSFSQDVGTFNAIFKQTPILGFPSDIKVEIKEILKGDERRIIVGDKEISQKIVQIKKKAKTLKTSKPVLKKITATEKKQLPSIFFKLNPTEFVVHQALATLGTVDGVGELSKQTFIARRTISKIIKNLKKMGFINTENFLIDGKTMTRINLIQ